MSDASSRNDHQSISPTAKITAYWRSLSDIPFSRDIAEAVNAELTAREMYGESIAALSKFPPPIFEVRYKSINGGLKRCKTARVMELACGLSPRGLEVVADGGVYVGTDLPDMSAESAPLITAIAVKTGLATTHLHLQPANVLNRDDLEQAAAHFHGGRFAVCNEGLLMYLDREEKALMAEHLRPLLLRAGGCWITPDITFQAMRAQLLSMLGPNAMRAAGPLKQRITEQVGRDFISNDFDDTSTAVRFYRALGFDIEEYPMYAGDYPLSTLSLIPADLQERFVHVLSSATAWILTPRA